MKYWNRVLANHLTFKQAADIMVKNVYFTTRPEWDGFHFLDKNRKYQILLKSGKIKELTINELNLIWDREKTDWMVVEPTKRAMEIIIAAGLL